MTAINQTSNGITLEVNMFQFINEYFADVYPGREPQFDYDSFRDMVHSSHSESIEIHYEDGTVNTLLDYNWDMDFYAEYGLLRAAYENQRVTMNIRERNNDRTGANAFWQYTVTFIANRKFIAIQFYTRWRITDFKEYEDEQNAAVIEELQNLINKKPVLCLESEQNLFKRAGQEIASAIQSKYYRDITDFEYPNYLEVLDWLGHGNSFFVDNIGHSLYESAVIKAFNWYEDGIKAGLIYDEIKK